MTVYDKNGQPYDADLVAGEEFRTLLLAYDELRCKQTAAGGFTVPPPAEKSTQRVFVFESAHTARDVREISQLLKKLVDAERELENVRNENDRLRALVANPTSL